MIRAIKTLAVLGALDALAVRADPLFLVRLAVDVALAPVGVVVYCVLGRKAQDEDLRRALVDHPAARGRMQEMIVRMVEESA